MGEGENVIGSVDPASMREFAGLGLYVEGKLDLDDSEVAREAWRSMKDNRVGLSFGYLTVKSRRRDGYNDLLELDLYEISIAPSPINPQTRILEMKATALAERDLPAAATRSPSRPRSAGSPYRQYQRPRLRRDRLTPSCANRPRRSAFPSHGRAREPENGSATTCSTC